VPAPTCACAACGAVEWRHAFGKGAHDYRRCVGCGLIVAYPIPTPDELREFYLQEYADPTRAGAALAAERSMALATARARLRSVLRLAGRGRWLEVGCSTGAFLEAAAAEAVDVEGIDLSDAAVGEARARGLRARALLLSECAPADPFDALIAFDVIEHLPDPAEFLEQARRVLRPSGRLVLTTPDTGTLSARLLGRRWYFYIPVVHITHFDRANLALLLRRHGFAVRHQRRAMKYLTFDYTVTQLGIGNPVLHRLAKLLGALLPARLRRLEFGLPIGEQFVVAEMLPR
jgi:SAM-dependent methyltransferase